MHRTDRELLNMVQHDFPLATRPYAHIAERLGMTEAECISRLAELNRLGILREIRPVVNWKSAGFNGILIGIAVDPDHVDDVAEAINTIPGVTHNYLREGRLNLWCTLTFDGEEEKVEYLAFMRSQPGVLEVKEFASEKTYKIGLLLNV